MYSFTGMVRYSETDESGYLSLKGLINYLQDCCLFQSESLGIGPEYLRKSHHLWLLSGWQVVIDRYPRMFEKITVDTMPYEFSGCLGWRNVRIRDAQDVCIVKANSPWVYLNTDTGRPERPGKNETEAYGTEEKLPMDYAPRKIKLPENMQSREPVPVIQEFIDTNHHVNNAQYVEIALNIVEEERQSFCHSDDTGVNGKKDLALRPIVREVRVEYKKQAVLGDVLYPRTGREDGWDYVTFEDREGRIYASVALRE